jgi:hypothetical protein
MSVYDFDGDGKAELAVKTAPGTKDGTGAYLSTGTAAGADNTAIYRNSTGYILTGPEWITVFDGLTGKERATIDYPVPRGNVSSWGDAYGNRVDRFNGGFAFVKDGGVANGLPSIIQGRGYYTRLTISALTYRNGVLAKNWVYDSVTSLQAQGAATTQRWPRTWTATVDRRSSPAQTTIDSAGTLKCQSGDGPRRCHGRRGAGSWQGHLGVLDSRGLLGVKMLTTVPPAVSTTRHRIPVSTPVVAAPNMSARATKPARHVRGQVRSCAPPVPRVDPVPGATSSYTGTPMNGVSLKRQSITKAGGGTLLTCAQCSGTTAPRIPRR